MSIKATGPHSYLSASLALFVLFALLGCEVVPPAVTLSVKIDECVDLTVNDIGIRHPCAARLSAYYTENLQVGCISFSQPNETVMREVFWEGESLSYNTSGLTLDLSAELESHLILFVPEVPTPTGLIPYEPLCQDLPDDIDLNAPCDEIPGCLLKLDGVSTQEANSYAIRFTDEEGRCQGTASSMNFTEVATGSSLRNQCVNQSVEGICTEGLGICQAEGVWVPMSGGEVCDATPLPAHSNDLCGTGLDEDCDGFVNESFPQFGRACTVEDSMGNQISGSLDCSEDRLSLLCKTTDNTCDGQDNDADGRFDEGYVPEPIDCNPGACSPAGFIRCINGERVSTCQQPNALSSEPELCDGFDNDCDGMLDEGFPVETIYCGVGQCQAEGRRVCVNGGFMNVCSPGTPSEEVCNEAGAPAFDEDCDGRINEGLNLMLCPVCPTGVTPGLEVCDQPINGRPAQDEDCDGRVNEGLLNDCGRCGDEPMEVCDNIDNDCDGPTDEGLLNACGFCGPLPMEVCDGLDNDCDGTPDEGTGMPSQTLLGICAGALTICQAGQLVNPGYSSIPGYQSPEQSCDGLDNDCDGTVDEDITTPGNLQGVCAGLMNVCNPATGMMTYATPSPAVPNWEPTEVSCADGLDNDCDGLVDAQDPDCVVVIDECDGIDNDNDEIVDEGTDEVCNARDDDCDGEVDEGVSNCIDQLKTLLQYKVTWDRPMTVGPEGGGQPSFRQVAHITHENDALLSHPASGSVTKDRVDLYRAQPSDQLNLEVAVYQTNFAGAQDWLDWIKGHCSVSIAWYGFDANQGSIPEVADCDTELNCIKVNLTTLGAPNMYVGSLFGRRPVLLSNDIETYSLELSCTKPGPLSSPQTLAEEFKIFELLKDHVALKTKEFDADSVTNTTPDICDLDSGSLDFERHLIINDTSYHRYQTLTKKLDQDCEIPLFTMSPN